MGSSVAGSDNGGSANRDWYVYVHKCAALFLVAAAFAGCGGEGDDGAPRESLGASGASVRSQSQSVPGLDAASPVARRAREAGRRACHGQTPIEVAHRYRAIAHQSGARRRFAAFVVDPTPEIAESPGYPRLVAALYATTVSASQREQAAAGCAEELAAASHGGEAQSKRTGQEELPGRGSQMQKGRN
jgi:hypothetical protein